MEATVPESIFASRARIGERYLTRAGHPVITVAPTMKGELVVRSELRGTTHTLAGSDLLYPYKKEKINQEAIRMANAEKKSGKGKKAEGARGGERGARKTSEGIVLTRKIGNATHEVLFHGGILTYRTKDYMTLKEVAEVIRGKDISGSGRSFFGLRTPGHIELGKEVLKGLADAESDRKAVEKKAQKDAHKSFPKPGKAKRAKKASSQEDEETPSKSKAEGVPAQAGVSARGRGR